MANLRRDIEAFLDSLSLDDGGQLPMLSQLPRTAELHSIEDDGCLAEATRDALLTEYQQHNYAIFEIKGASEVTPQIMLSFAGSLCLGRAFRPPLYFGLQTSHLFSAEGINLITANRLRENQVAHPAFESQAALEFHTDGTLQPIGFIRTVVLLCVAPAAQGGETLLFDAVRAFAALALHSRDCAMALLHRQALVREATVNGSKAKRSGPVFALRGRDLISRYSTTPRDKWMTDRIPRLAEAREALADMSRPGSPFSSQVLLRTGQGIVLANDKIAHGRTSFVDSARQPRCMLRGLFLRCPGRERKCA